MNFEITSHLGRGVRTKWLELIEAAGLVPDEKNERTLADAGDRIANGDTRQTAATRERRIADGCSAG